MTIEDRIKIRAYYRWLNRDPGLSDGAEADWLAAEQEQLMIERSLATGAMEISSSGKEATDSFPANAERASFHFQRLLVKMPCNSAQIFGADDSLDFSSSHWPTLAHELTHYVQAVSTVLGQRILMNWFAVQIAVAKHLLNIKPLPVPLNHVKAQQNPGVLNAVLKLRDYINETTALSGARHPLRPAEEAGKTPEYSLYDYSERHPRDGRMTKQVAISMRDGKGIPFGVPILGDALTEGMAQVVQWMAKPDDIGARLAARSVTAVLDGSFDIYYTALVRTLRARFPNWDCGLLTLCVTDAALCARHIGTALAEILQFLGTCARPLDFDGYRRLRSRFDQLPTVAAGRNFILAEIAAADAGIPQDASGIGRLFRRMLQLFRDGWAVRATNPAIILDQHYRDCFFETVMENFGAPPIFFNDRSHYVRLTDDMELEQAFHAMSGTYEILLGLAMDGLTKECSLLRTQMCQYRKTVACREDLLSVPIGTDRRACVMAFAASSLGLYARPLKRHK